MASTLTRDAGASRAPARYLTRTARPFHPPPARAGVLPAGESQRLSVVLAEYAAVRNEIQTALSNQQSALSVGTAALGLLAAVGAHFWPKDLMLSGLVFAFAVPAACAVAIRMWYGELLRIARAARFVSEIEDWVNRSSSTTLGWERWMSECRALPGQDIDYANWRAVMQGFGALAAMSVALGLVFLVRAEGAGPAIAVALAVAVLSSNVCLHVRRLKRRAATYLDHRPEPPVIVHDARDAA